MVLLLSVFVSRCLLLFYLTCASTCCVYCAIDFDEKCSQEDLWDVDMSVYYDPGTYTCRLVTLTTGGHADTCIATTTDYFRLVQRCYTPCHNSCLHCV